MDRDDAVYSPELKRSAALTEVGVDGITNLALDGDREAYRDEAVYGLCHQVCGIIIWSLYGDAAIRRLREEAPDSGAFSRSDPARWTKTVDFGWR